MGTIIALVLFIQNLAPWFINRNAPGPQGYHKWQVTVIAPSDDPQTWTIGNALALARNTHSGPENGHIPIGIRSSGGGVLHPMFSGALQEFCSMFKSENHCSRLEKEMESTAVLLPGESQDESRPGCRLRSHRVGRLSDFLKSWSWVPVYGPPSKSYF